VCGNGKGACDDGCLAGCSGDEGKLDEAAGEDGCGRGITRELLEGAGNGTAVPVDAVSVIALFAADAVDDLVAAARQRTIRAAGGVGEVAVLGSEIAILSEVQASVAAEHRIEASAGSTDGDVGGGGTGGGEVGGRRALESEGYGRDRYVIRSQRALRRASVGIAQVAIVALLTRICDAVAADEEGNKTGGRSGIGRGDGERGGIRRRNGEVGVGGVRNGGGTA